MSQIQSFACSYVEDYKEKHPIPPPQTSESKVKLLKNGCVVRIIEGDLTKMKCDAIVSSSVGDLAHIG